MSGKASLREIQEYYDLDDLAWMHELLDLEIEIHEQMKRNANQR